MIVDFTTTITITTEPRLHRLLRKDGQAGNRFLPVPALPPGGNVYKTVICFI